MKNFAPRLRHLALAGLGATAVMAQAGLAVPAYSSRPGAAYTVYLDFGGFAFTGNWSSGTPGTTPAYSIDSNTSSYTNNELTSIRESWARTAEKYTAFNVNVTTVDPAVAANQAGSDALRQSYYDKTAQLMHTVIGGTGDWSGGGGVSFVGTTKNAYAGTNSGNTNGYHTNWIFSGQAPTALQFVAEASAHENGHGLGLNHQSDRTTTPTTQYSPGDNAGATNDNSSVAPIMGVSYYNQRGLWRTGTLSNGTIQNDVQTLLSNPNMSTFVDDGVGHSLATATSLALSGNAINSALAAGYISPASSSAPNALGIDNYTKDYFAFNTNGSAISLTLNAGAQRITTGVADPGATFDGRLNILNSFGNVVGSSTISGNTLFSTYSGTLAAGTYYAQIVGYGGYTSTRELNAQYYTMGSYFLTGSGGFQAVPEPATWAALGLGVLAVLRRRRKA